MMRQEPGLHHLIRAHTTIPVAEVVGHDFSRTQINRDYLLMSALPGVPLSDVPGLTQARFDRALRQVGEYLRLLWPRRSPGDTRPARSIHRTV